MAGIYYHIPFCKRICSYCDFYRTAQRDRLPEVIDAMAREIDARAGYLGGAPIRTRYFGGGTPSLCTVGQLQTLLRRTAERFDCSAVEETTLEANPDDLTADYLAALRRIGIDRLSIGIQSFDDACLRFMNRRHTAAEAEDAVRRARAAGFDNLTVDLIFGVPGFGGASFERSLDRLLALDVPHVSAYLLTVEPRTRFGVLAARGELQEVPDTRCEEEYFRIHERLTAAGYCHYEVSNYAREGFRARHNSRYWDGTPYLGIGPAAHSYDGASRQWNVASVERYLGGEAPERELLTDEDRRLEYLLTRLRTAEGFATADFGARFGAVRRERLLEAARPELAAGRLELCEGRLRIPPRRMLVSDAVIAALAGGEEDG